MPTNFYRKNLFTDSAVKFLTDDLQAALISSAYAPDYDLHDFFDDASANEVAGAGYTAGGLALASKTRAYIAANSWATTWAASTAFVGGDVVRPAAANGYIYLAQNAGATGASAPTWPTVLGDEVADGAVTWTCIGRGGWIFDCTDPSWNPTTLTNVRYVVVYDRTPATDATRPLLCCIDLGSNLNPTNGQLLITLNASAGLLVIPIN